ncbi:hypothetical protein A0J61_06904 [Choanephora cucurbitarum]|uniref:Uncharacterized protein n=1 Tax=Choanephora cucurbitarum TaxID=101091 RepID=A0A1C7N7U9_9FUNG|nr:hypothetical protein A0J61_06904 [Choanephora cucurbitarum]
MPLKLITNLVSSLLRRHEATDDMPIKEYAESPQRSSSLATLSFSPTATIQGLWTKKEEQNDAENEKWIMHQEQLTHWHNQAPLFDPQPKLTVHDYEFIETLGTYYTRSFKRL